VDDRRGKPAGACVAQGWCVRPRCCIARGLRGRGRGGGGEEEESERGGERGGGTSGICTRDIC